jgi:serine protease
MNMKRALVLAFPCLVIGSAAFAGEPSRDAQRDSLAATEILIDLQDDTNDADERAIEELLGGIDLKLNSAHAGDERFFIGEVDELAIDEMLAKVRMDPRVEHAEPNFVYAIPELDFEGLVPVVPIEPAPLDGMTPNDPLWERQWSFRMIGMPQAWQSANGDGVVVAVIDTGVAFEEHKSFRRVEDLAGIGFVKPYDFVNDTNHSNDDHGHGTHVAGTIAQATNNNVGVAGIAFKAKIMPLKVLNRAGMGTVADIADAIRYAADEGANVINMSLGGGARSMVMESAVAYARKKGVVVVCAAGNGSRNRVEYPAAYPGAFAVSSVGPDKKLAYYSSYGKELAISAPGGDKQKGGDAGAILQNTITPDRVGATNVYLAFQGTSMATPHVAGVAALIIGAGVTDAAKVEEILKSTAEDTGEAGWDERYGAGILNAARAVEAANETTGGLRYLLTGLGALVLMLFSTRAGRASGMFGVKSILGVVFGASGLWFLKCLGLGIASIPVLGLFTEPMPQWDGALFGASWHFTALWASAIPIFALTVLLLGAKKLRGLLVGLAFGWAAHLLLSAIFMPADVQLIPGVASVFDRIWLIINAGALFILARLIATARSTRSAT